MDPEMVMRLMGIDAGVYVLARARSVEHGEAIAARLVRKGVEAVVVVLQAPARIEDGVELIKRLEELDSDERGSDCSTGKSSDNGTGGGDPGSK